jgi:hypothetical protein
MTRVWDATTSFEFLFLSVQPSVFYGKNSNYTRLKIGPTYFSLISLFSCKTDHFPPNEVEIKIALSKFGQLSFKTPKLIK